MNTRILLLFAFSAVSAFAGPPFEPTLDLSSATGRHVVIAAGTPEIYQGHATTALLADGKTMFAVWTTGHGGPCGPVATSPDGGKTWARIDERFPAEYASWKNCPAIYRMTDPQGSERLWIFACGKTDTPTEGATAITRVMSEDNGTTWRVMPPLPVSTSVMPICSLLRLNDGTYIAQYNGPMVRTQTEMEPRFPNRLAGWRADLEHAARRGAAGRHEPLRALSAPFA